MSEARLSIQFAGALVTFQDKGRVGHMRYGVAASGPMDRVAFSAANAALGNEPGVTAVEISLGGLMLTCDSGSVTVAIAGGDFTVEHAGQKITSWRVITLNPGDTLSVRAGKSGSWAYLAFAGTVQAKKWLGHSATHSTSGFGGGALQSGQELVVQNAAIRENREGQIESPGFLKTTGRVRVVLGPQEKWFREQALSAFCTNQFQLTDSYDRMGVRLKGPELPLDGALSIPSEPILRGSVQVSGEGVATILLADHQTTGGYPKIATVISPDIDVLAQMRSGDGLEFDAITAPIAVDISRKFAADWSAYLEKVAVPQGSLQQRLMQENLISGVISSI